MFIILLHLVIQAGLILRAVLRPHRDPASRIAWVLVIMMLPVVGILSYLLLGETNIGWRRIERMNRVLADLPKPDAAPGWDVALARAQVPERHLPIIRAGQSVSGFEPVGGNRGQLLADADAAIDALVADIESARDHVHLLFYIWLPDGNGTRVADALVRAAGRGVACRAMVDDLGSRLLIGSPVWTSMAAGGVRLARALPIGNPLLRVFNGRIDLRNHRKIAVIDDTVTYCGSQNCADPEFRIKAKYAPWVDAVMRFEGPIARQNQYLFAADWMAYVDEDLHDLLVRPIAVPAEGGLSALVTGSGPTVRHSAMPELFETVMYSARSELVITTPYYVPDDSMQAALCASARRGVATSIVFPARNDSWFVATASRSYYRDLLVAGVEIHEYLGGLLHAKSMTMDGEITLIGSANMDRRSFDLNYENNILFYDPDLTAEMRARQESYIARSRPVTRAEVDAWSWHDRLVHNSVAMLGPVL